MLYFTFTNETTAKMSQNVFNRLLTRAEQILDNRLKKKMGEKNGVVELVLVDDNKIQMLNAEYRRKDDPTDVISFAYLEIMDQKEQKDDNIIVGDIFISIDTAKRQAKEKGHSLTKEMEILFVHGLLHCMGFDHRTDKEEAEMEGWAKKILEN